MTTSTAKPASVDITAPPAAVQTEIRELRAGLDAELPPKLLDRNLLVATWNIRTFGDLTRKWRSGPRDSPKRDLRDLWAIAEIVSRFDVVAIQEVRGELEALRQLLSLLGRDWEFVLTDVTKGSDGNDERLAFVFDTRRIRPSGLACEFVVPVVDTARAAPGAFNRQFARTPFAVSFRASGETLILVTLHIDYGKKAEDRLPELEAIAEWLQQWAERQFDMCHNVVALGDMNIAHHDDELFEAFTSTGLVPAPGLETVPRSPFDEPGHLHLYDQIAWFTDPAKGPALTLDCSRAGHLDFVALLDRDDDDIRTLSYRISDHYPLWVEFSIRPERERGIPLGAPARRTTGIGRARRAARAAPARRVPGAAIPSASEAA